MRPEAGFLPPCRRRADRAPSGRGDDSGIGPGRPGLAELIRSRDRLAIQNVVPTYLEQVLRAARGAGLSEQEAENVTQATLTTFIERASEFEGRSHVRTWIFGILYPKIAEARRRIDRDREVAHLDEALEARFDLAGG